MFGRQQTKHAVLSDVADTIAELLQLGCKRQVLQRAPGSGAVVEGMAVERAREVPQWDVGSLRGGPVPAGRPGSYQDSAPQLRKKKPMADLDYAPNLAMPEFNESDDLTIIASKKCRPGSPASTW